MSTAEQEYAYSVWAFPTPEVSDRLRGVMSGLRDEFSGPRFDPHVTLVGAIRLTPSEAIKRFRAACSGVKPYAAKVADVGQWVDLLIEPTPEVVGASAHCCGHFEYKSSTPYMPHLSLLYGDLTDEEKEKAKEKVKALDPSILDLSFEVAALALYKTDTEDKTLESWEQICVCDLKTGCKEGCC